MDAARATRMVTDLNPWAKIRRRVLVEHESKRSVCREYDIHWDTLTKILEHSEPPGYPQARPRVKRKIGPFVRIIEEILKQGQAVHRKQRHTKRRIFERLRTEHGYTGGYTAVKDVVRAWPRGPQEVFVPLSHPPGEAQVDLGRARIVHHGEEITVAMFVMTLPYSDAIFICVFPRECTETFQEGHCRAFAFFGGVPRRISYDNRKIAVSKIGGRRDRECPDEFLRLESHFLFEHHFCLVRRANQKGPVENLLGFARRNFLVPVPKVDSIEALNGQLEEACRRDLQRICRGKAGTKAERLAGERDHFLPLPAEAFEAHRLETPQANSLSLVRFDGNDSSVPTAYAHHNLTAIGTVEEVRIRFGDEVIATHRRCWTKQKVVFDPIHYLALLERKPGALDVARPLEDWSLPDCFTVLRRRLEHELEDRGFLRQLCEMELLDRERRAAERRLKAAKFPTYKTLENFDFTAQPSINRPLFTELMRCAYIDKRENILLVGNPGTGKTHAATALAVEACGRGKRVRFWRVTELITQLIEAREERALSRMKNQLARRELLVLIECNGESYRLKDAKPRRRGSDARSEKASEE